MSPARFRCATQLSFLLLLFSMESLFWRRGFVGWMEKVVHCCVGIEWGGGIRASEGAREGAGRALCEEAEDCIS